MDRSIEWAARSSGPFDRLVQPIGWAARSTGLLDRPACPAVFRRFRVFFGGFGRDVVVTC
ncbi:hypothetical protein HanRHA438_Chr03g0113181 [Helianthus annuus]|nr:hypothetical protein HanRHA438_Chr03g0113181 [Helianthus annuus]